MFILPYVYHIHELPHTTIHIITILTVGGRTLWQEEDNLQVVEDVLQPNGLLPLSSTQYKDVTLCELDPSQVNWSDYYQWKETDDPSELFCWRSFYLLGTPWNHLPASEGLHPYSYQELFSHLLSTTPQKSVSKPVPRKNI